MHKSPNILKAINLEKCNIKFDKSKWSYNLNPQIPAKWEVPNHLKDLSNEFALRTWEPSLRHSTERQNSKLSDFNFPTLAANLSDKFCILCFKCDWL